MSEETKNLINVIIVLAVVVLVIFIFANAAKIMFPGLFDMFKKDLSSDEKNQLVETFDKSVENINACDKINDDECICEGFANFQKIPTYSLIEIDNINQEIRIYYQKKELKKNSFEAYIFNVMPVSVDDSGIMLSFENQLNSEKISLSFLENKEFPILHGIGTYVPEGAIPIEEEKKLDVISGYFLKTNIDELNILGIAQWNSKMEINEKNKEKMILAVENLPKCQNERSEAIKNFDDLISFINKINNMDIISLPEDYPAEINLPKDYIIKFNDKKIWLEYNAEIVKKLAYPLKESMPIDLVSVNVEYQIITLCEDSQQSGELHKGDVIKLKKKENKTCLFAL